MKHQEIPALGRTEEARKRNQSGVETDLGVIQAIGLYQITDESDEAIQVLPGGYAGAFSLIGLA